MKLNWKRGTFKKVKIKEELKFKSYTEKNHNRLKELAGKTLYVKKISGFFYQIENEGTLVFFSDFKKLEDEPYKRLCREKEEFEIIL